MLTAFQDEEYKMSAFASLADGYLEKPFSLSLLKVRVDAIFKRYYDTGRIFSYKDARVDFESYSASLAGEEVAINAKELEILDYLVKNEGRALTRSQIIDAVWKVTDEVPFDVSLMSISRNCGKSWTWTASSLCAMLVINWSENETNRFIYKDIYLYLLDF